MKSVSRKGFLVRGTTTQEVAISMEDAFWVLERGLGFTDAYSLGVRDEPSRQPRICVYGAFQQPQMGRALPGVSAFAGVQMFLCELENHE